MSDIFNLILRCFACALTIVLVAFLQASEADDTAAVRVTEKSAKSSPAEGLKLTGVRNGDGQWGLAIGGPGTVAAQQCCPLQVEIWDGERGLAPRILEGGYETLVEESGAWPESGVLKAVAEVSHAFQDRWTVDRGTLQLTRVVTVRGDGGGGLRTSTSFQVTEPHTWPDAKWLPRGVRGHQLWLAWVSVRQLCGINDLIDFDPRLYSQLAGSVPNTK